MEAAKDSAHHVEQCEMEASKPAPMTVPAALSNLSPDERKEKEKALVRKIDTRLLIMMLVMYILNYLDRNNIAAAKLAGLQKDLKLKGNEYQVRAIQWLNFAQKSDRMPRSV